MTCLFSPKLLDEFLDAVLVKKRLLFRRIDSLIRQCDFEPGIQESQLAQSRGQSLEFKFGRDREDRRVGQKRDQRAGILFVFDLADDAEFFGRFAALEGHVINLAVARDFDLEPVGERVDAFGADAVQAAGIFVGALAELAARVQIGQDQLDRRHFPFRMNIDRNAAAVVAHGDRAIDVDGHVDLVAKSGQMFVDRVIENFENHVMQTALIRVADVHAGRFRTASRPSSLSIWAASYFWAVSMPVGRADETDFAGKSSSVFGIEDGRATTDKYGSGKWARHNKYLG